MIHVGRGNHGKDYKGQKHVEVDWKIVVMTNAKNSIKWGGDGDDVTI